MKPASPNLERALKGYQWPASRLTKGDMMKLSELRDQTGEPITQLLHEAVETYYRVLMEGEEERSEQADPIVRQ